MVHKHVDGRTPTADLQADDKTLLAQAYGARALVIQSMDTQALHTALEQLWQVIGEGNRYVDAQAPWALRKTDMVRMATVLYTVMETLRVVVIPLQAFMPESATKMLDILGVPREQRGIEHMQSTYALASGTGLPPLTPVFPRYVEG
jgi:methionyl-tRNA synthetase